MKDTKSFGCAPEQKRSRLLQQATADDFPLASHSPLPVEPWRYPWRRLSPGRDNAGGAAELLLGFHVGTDPAFRVQARQSPDEMGPRREMKGVDGQQKGLTSNWGRLRKRKYVTFWYCSFM